MQVGIDSFAAAFDENSLAVNPAERLRPQRSRRITTASFAKCSTGSVTSGACSSSPCSKRGRRREPGFRS